MLIARTAIRKDHFQLRKLALSPWYGVTCNKRFVTIKRVAGVVDVCALPLPVAPLGTAVQLDQDRSAVILPLQAFRELQHLLRYHFDCVCLVKCVDDTLLMTPQWCVNSPVSNLQL